MRVKCLVLHMQDSVAFAIRASTSTDHENTHLRRQLASQSKFLDVGKDSKGESVRIRYCVLGARKPGSAQYVASVLLSVAAMFQTYGIQPSEWAHLIAPAACRLSTFY